MYEYMNICICIQYIYILVGGFNPSEKYESQLGWLFPIYGKIIQMFQTTNQYICVSVYIYMHVYVYIYIYEYVYIYM